MLRGKLCEKLKQISTQSVSAAVDEPMHVECSPSIRQVASEKLSRQLEAEMSEANIKMAELERELRDVTAQRNRLQLELNDASSRLQTAENQLSQAQRAKTALANQLDGLRQVVDESSAAHTKVHEHHALKVILSHCLITLLCCDIYRFLL